MRQNEDCMIELITKASTQRYKDGMIYVWNKSGNIVPPSYFKEHDITIDRMDLQQQAYDEDTERTIAEYRERMKDHVYSDEELFEMRAAFGPGETVVNVLTGQEIKL